MTRQEYLKELENNLSSLTNDEKKEAVQYYSDYFDDANDDEKIMNELGSPEVLAKTIVEKMANGLAKTEAESKEESSFDEKTTSRGSLYYKFNKEDVKNLTLTFAAVEVVAISGNCYSVETRGISKEDLIVTLSPEGVLNISNNKRINFNFWNHSRETRIVPRILLTIPENAELNRLKISLGAGNFETRNISLNYITGRFEVGAGNLVLDRVYGADSDFRCGMGNLCIKGELKKQINIDCGMGAIKLNLRGNIDDYSYDAKVGMGDVRINNEKKVVAFKNLQTDKKENNFSINCGMGSVNIQIEK